MVRVTHVEADGVDVLVDGHHVECRLPRARGEVSSSNSDAGKGDAFRAFLSWMAMFAVEGFELGKRLARYLLAEMLSFVVLSVIGLLELLFTAVRKLFSSVLLPLAREIVCIVGASLLCPVGVLGHYLANASLRVGQAMQRRSRLLLGSARLLTAATDWVRQPRADAAVVVIAGPFPTDLQDARAALPIPKLQARTARVARQNPRGLRTLHRTPTLPPSSSHRTRD